MVYHFSFLSVKTEPSLTKIWFEPVCDLMSLELNLESSFKLCGLCIKSYFLQCLLIFELHKKFGKLQYISLTFSLTNLNYTKITKKPKHTSEVLVHNLNLILNMSIMLTIQITISIRIQITMLCYRINHKITLFSFIIQI